NASPPCHAQSLPYCIRPRKRHQANAPTVRLVPAPDSRHRIVNQNNSSIGFPLGRTAMGRPALLRYCCSVLIPRCWYNVASTSCGVLGSFLGNAPLASDAPTTRPPLTEPPARAALKTLG